MPRCLLSRARCTTGPAGATIRGEATHGGMADSLGKSSSSVPPSSQSSAAAESRAAHAALGEQVQNLPSGSGFPGDPPAFREVNELLGPVSPGGLPRFVVEQLRPFVSGAGLFNAKFGGIGFPFGGLLTPGSALAQTWGRTIYFARGQYSPGSVSGLAIIGHESIHVTQFVRGGAGFIASAAFQEVGAFFTGRGLAYEAVAYSAQFAISRGLGGP